MKILRYIDAGGAWSGSKILNAVDTIPAISKALAVMDAIMVDSGASG
ncbi:hypothetical protein GOB93_20640 [Acetobacter musti]|uniref:Uncharacterized protein n=2 Tax=Acetobacter musti TaxID=864732 RepID=A0ABX0JYS7_9PROT|nr:hypothetical protein [Acetobacter musti]